MLAIGRLTVYENTIELGRLSFSLAIVHLCCRLDLVLTISIFSCSSLTFHLPLHLRKMADPITLFGAAAGALQLSDVVLRASRDAYGLLTSVKDSSKDIEALRDGNLLSPRTF
jgi:hypothetical protein